MSRVYVVITPCPLISISTISRVKASPLHRDAVIANGDRRLDEGSSIAVAVLERGRARARCRIVVDLCAANYGYICSGMIDASPMAMKHTALLYDGYARISRCNDTRYLFQCRRWKSPNDDDRGISLVSDRQRIR